MARRWNQIRLVENRFADRAVETAKLRELETAGYRTARKSDEKAHRVITVSDQAQIEAVGKALERKLYSPALVIIGYDAMYAWRRRDMRYYLDYGVADSDAEAMKYLIAAEGSRKGLKLVETGDISSRAVRVALGLPESLHVTHILETGYEMQVMTESAAPKAAAV